MSNYSKTTDFAAKDSLPSGDSGKIIRGSEFETEFDNISTAIATKADAASPTFTGTVTIDGLTVNGNTTLGNAATDTVTVTADIASNLIPSADDTYNLGASGAEWNDLFIDGTANIDSLVADTADINGGTIDGVTIGGSSAGAITGTTITGTSFVTSGNMTFGDNDKAIFGAGSDLQIYHDGSNSYITDSGTGNLNILANEFALYEGNGTDLMIGATPNGAVTLSHNAQTKLATTSTGIDITGNATFADNGKAIFGAGSDLSIYHDGSNSYIDDSGTGLLRLRSNQIYLEKYTGEIMAALTADAGVNLRYDNAIKLQTTSTGIDVTGTVTADDVNLSTKAVVGGATPRIELFESDTTDLNARIRNTGGQLQIQSTDDAGTTSKTRIEIDHATGDIAFREDTGTTAKLFWDASAESLGIGVDSPQASLHIVNDASKTQFIASGTVGNDRFLAIDVDISGDENVAYITVDQADALAFGEKTNDNDRTIANEHMRIDASGHLIVPNGVTLGTAVGTYAAANTLDDYEEGTWLGAVADAESGGNESSTDVNGTYVKIGKIVYVQFNVSNINTTGMTAGNEVYITGLPFTSKSVTGNAKYTGTAHMSVVAFEQAPILDMNESATVLRIGEVRNGAGVDHVVVSQLTSGSSDIHGNLVYQTA